jgi:hypothetical protein
MPGYGLDGTGIRVAPKRMRAAFAFEIASLPTKMSEQDAALHPT